MKSRLLSSVTLALTVVGVAVLNSGCSVKEEVRRIEQVKIAEQLKAASNSDDLTGEQVFIRSCNTCHPSGRKGVGPALDKINEHFSGDQELIALIRTGMGMMPGQSQEILNDQEMTNLIAYLRSMNVK